MGISCQLTRFKGLAAIITVAATLTACTTGGGNPLDTLTGEAKYAPEFVKANITPKKSTKEQIRQKFGTPTSVQDNVGNNSSEWTYDRRDSGFNAVKKMAYRYTNKYGSGEAGSALWQGESRVGDAQEIMDDASTLTGTGTAGKKTTITTISIHFRGEVVSEYSTN